MKLKTGNERLFIPRRQNQQSWTTFLPGLLGILGYAGKIIGAEGASRQIDLIPEVNHRVISPAEADGHRLFNLVAPHDHRVTFDLSPPR
jgi:hypothetical protein